jgi:hypothetical protein
LNKPKKRYGYSLDSGTRTIKNIKNFNHNKFKKFLIKKQSKISEEKRKNLENNLKQMFSI